MIGLLRVIWLTPSMEALLRVALWQNVRICRGAMKLKLDYSARWTGVALGALVCVAAAGFVGSDCFTVSAQGGQEREQTLFVQAPDFAGAGDSIDLVWLPEPLESTCVGRTTKECARIDYCIRTTNPDSAQCRNLGIRRADFPHYPAGMQPRRMIVVTMRKLTNDHGFDRLKEFYRSAPSSSLNVLSMDARIRARIRYDDNPSFEGFTLLEVLEAPAR